MTRHDPFVLPRLLPMYADGYQVPGKAVMLADRPIASVSDTYQLVPNKYVQELMEMALRPMGTMQASARISDDGCRSSMSWLLKDMRHEIAVGDVVGFRITACNSYDMSENVSITGGTLRLVCRNGAVAHDGKGLMFKRRHSGSILAELKAYIPQAVENAVQSFDVMCKRYKKWQQHQLDKDEHLFLFRSLAELCSSGDNIAITAEAFKSRFAAHERQEIGYNCWAVYNTATYWASHDDDTVKVMRKSKSAVWERLAQRQRIVHQWAMQEFLRLEAA